MRCAKAFRKKPLTLQAKFSWLMRPGHRDLFSHDRFPTRKRHNRWHARRHLDNWIVRRVSNHCFPEGDTVRAAPTRRPSCLEKITAHFAEHPANLVGHSLYW